MPRVPSVREEEQKGLSSFVCSCPFVGCSSHVTEVIKETLEHGGTGEHLGYVRAFISMQKVTLQNDTLTSKKGVFLDLWIRSKVFVQKLRKQSSPGFAHPPPHPPPPPGFSEHRLFSEPCFLEDASALGAHRAAIFTHNQKISLGVA